MYLIAFFVETVGEQANEKNIKIAVILDTPALDILKKINASNNSF